MKTILVDAAGTFVLKDIGIFEEMHALLEAFPNEKIIVSNANDEEVIAFGLVDLPYPLFTLKHEPNKTEPEYFVKLLKQYNLRPEDVVYFEHTPAAVDSARSLGIVSYWYDSEKKDLEGLKEFLKKNC